MSTWVRRGDCSNIDKVFGRWRSIWFSADIARNGQQAEQRKEDTHLPYVTPRESQGDYVFEQVKISDTA